MAQSTNLKAKNLSGATIAANTAVYINGVSDDDDALPTLAVASNDSESKMPAVGLVRDELPNGEIGLVKITGNIGGIDTTAAKKNNTPIFVGRNGALVFKNPSDTSNSAVVQQLGVVTVIGDAENGQMYLFPLEVQLKHAKTHKPTKSDPFLHAAQHEKGGGDEIDHNKIKNINLDGHPQYILVNGKRAFTAPVSGVDPIKPSHLVTKHYVDGLGQVVSTTFGSAADGYVAFFLNDRTIAGDNDFFWDRINNSLGIGTSSPSSFKLQVDGYIGPNADNVYGLGSPSLRWQNLNVGPGSIHIKSTAAETGVAQNWTLGIKTESDAGNFHISRDGNNYITANTDGNIGIGSISPSAFKLQVDGYIGPHIDNVYGLGTPSKRWQSLSVGPGSLHIISTAAETNGIAYDWTLGIKQDTEHGSFFIGQGNNNYFKVDTGGVVKISNISSDGYTNPGLDNTYGLGTTATRWRNISLAPDNSLHFTSTAAETGTAYDWTMGVRTDTIKGALHLSRDGINYLKIDPNGNALFGVSEFLPDRPLVVSSDANTQAAGESSLMVVGTSNKERIEIRSFGTTPGATFRGVGGRGTVNAPTQTISGDTLLQLHCAGVDNNGAITANNRARIMYVAEETYTTALQGTYIRVDTTAAGGVNSTEKVRITSTGEFHMGGTGGTAANSAATTSALLIDGTQNSMNGPHIHLTTSAIDNRPLLQILGWRHDDIEIAFDNFWNGSTQTSSSSNGSFTFIKGTNTFRLMHGIATVNTTVSLTANTTWTASGGMQVGAPTGGDKGVGGINASNVYDDNVLLTCYIPEYVKNGSIDLEKWDNTIPENSFLHKAARRFLEHAQEELNPTSYANKWLNTGHLPAMPSPAEWQDGNNKLSVGRVVQGLWETVEVLAEHIRQLNERIKKLENL